MLMENVKVASSSVVLAKTKPISVIPALILIGIRITLVNVWKDTINLEIVLLANNVSINVVLVN